jgi:hypothetical protein
MWLQLLIVWAQLVKLAFAAAGQATSYTYEPGSYKPPLPCLSCGQAASYKEWISANGNVTNLLWGNMSQLIVSKLADLGNVGSASENLCGICANSSSENVCHHPPCDEKSLLKVKKLKSTRQTMLALQQLAGVHALATREITTNGCPNHPSFCTGNPFTKSCGPIGGEGNSTIARELKKGYHVMAYPVIAVNPLPLGCKRGALGVAYNGVSISGMALTYDTSLFAHSSCCSSSARSL